MLPAALVSVALLLCCSAVGATAEQGPDVSGLSSRDALLVNLLYASTLEAKRRSPAARQATFEFPVIRPSAEMPPELGSGPAVSTLWFPVHADQQAAVGSLHGSAPAVISAPLIHAEPQEPSVGVAHPAVPLSPSANVFVASNLPTPPPLPTGAYIDPNVLPTPPSSHQPLPPSNPFNEIPIVDRSG
uniref:DUF4794 domain-containing protein n=1 Tax=Trichuris muris TaxID=70415 RepID=A0A5S6R611_TRIMR